MAQAVAAVAIAAFSEQKQQAAERGAERKREKIAAGLESQRKDAALKASKEAREKLRKRQLFGLQSTRQGATGDAPVFKKTLLGQ